MAKSTHADAPSATGNGSRPTVAMLQPEAMTPEAMTEACNRLLKHMDEMNRACTEAIRQAHNSGWDLASRLSRCSDPMEMNRLCADWMAERRDALMSDGRRLSEMWLRMCEQEFQAMPAPTPAEAQRPVARMAAAE